MYTRELVELLKKSDFIERRTELVNRLIYVNQYGLQVEIYLNYPRVVFLNKYGWRIKSRSFFRKEEVIFIIKEHST